MRVVSCHCCGSDENVRMDVVGVIQISYEKREVRKANYEHSNDYGYLYDCTTLRSGYIPCRR